ncbi:MAG: 3-phosphoshikimate 1-carboxyvinyltransferase [Muribaculaceae bacterium]|nr:3-phosphoshikimate 1-carboxyvinyltransferase [Muribaculaceae bacterium]
MNYRIFPPDEMMMATIGLPLSKSISNRMLIINALTPGASALSEIAECDDTDLLSKALALAAEATGEITVNTGAAGTATRFITAYLCSRQGISATVDGSERMRRRPMGILIDSLRALGADIKCLDNEGYLPLHINGKQLKGGHLSIDASVSSQFISALMMIAPTMADGLTLHLDGNLLSKPYIDMTAELMRRSGAEVEFEAPYEEITIAPRPYCKEGTREAERDWSAASYWYEASALTAGFVTMPGLQLPSLQGDSACARLFEMLGVNTEPSEDVDNALEVAPTPEQFSRFETDLVDTPDLAQTLAVTAAMLGIPFHLRGLQSLRVKETDRLEALRAELDKFGIIVEIRNDSELVWNGARHPIFERPVIDTYDDHRMAMSFAPTAVIIPGIVIRDAEVVSKSYPGFWDDLTSAGFTITDADIPDNEAFTPEMSIDPSERASENPLPLT